MVLPQLLEHPRWSISTGARVVSEESLPRQVTIKWWAGVWLRGCGTADAEEWPHQGNVVIMKHKGGAVWLLCLVVLAFLMLALLTLLKGNRKGNFTLHTYFRARFPSPCG